MRIGEIKSLYVITLEFKGLNKMMWISEKRSIELFNEYSHKNEHGKYVITNWDRDEARANNVDYLDTTKFFNILLKEKNHG